MQVACALRVPHCSLAGWQAAAANPVCAPAPLEFTLRSAPHPQDGADTRGFQ